MTVPHNSSPGAAAIFARVRTVLVVGLGLFLAACYGVDEPVITKDTAVEVPGLEGEVSFGSNGEMVVFTFDPLTVSYLGAKTIQEGEVELSPPILIMPLRDQLYWFQFAPDDDGTYQLWIYEFDRSEKRIIGPYIPPMVEDEEELRQFAARYGVTVTVESEKLPSLTGPRDNILAFLRAHADVPLEKPD